MTHHISNQWNAKNECGSTALTLSWQTLNMTLFKHLFLFNIGQAEQYRYLPGPVFRNKIIEKKIQEAIFTPGAVSEAKPGSGAD